MIKLFNANPFAEAMLYYSQRMNNGQSEKRLVEIIKPYSEHKEKLEKIIKLSVSLKEKLDRQLKVDNRLIDKYFKKFDNLNSKLPFGFCLASIMVFYPLMDRFELSVDEMCKYLSECDMKERMFSFCFGLMDKCESLYDDESGVEEFSRRLEKLQLPLEYKWKIQSAAFNYRVHIDELLSLIEPAAKLIEAAKTEYEDIINEFFECYSKNNAQTLLESYFEIKFKPFDIIKAAPMIFGFDKIFGAFSLNNTSNPNSENNIAEDRSAADPLSTGRLLIGVARHLISRSAHDEISVMSEKMKALSDPTRLEILFYLCSHREYGQELCAKFGLVRSALSYHVTKLQSVGFVTAEVVGGQTYYTADKEGIRRMSEAFAARIK